MRKVFRRAALAVVLAATALPAAAERGRQCIVTDPTGTPLNVRLAPYSRIIGTIANGVGVTILDRTTDENGEPWVHIVHSETGAEIGWVYRKYVSCY